SFFRASCCGSQHDLHSVSFDIGRAIPVDAISGDSTCIRGLIYNITHLSNRKSSILSRPVTITMSSCANATSSSPPRRSLRTPRNYPSSFRGASLSLLALQLTLDILTTHDSGIDPIIRNSHPKAEHGQAVGGAQW